MKSLILNLTLILLCFILFQCCKQSGKQIVIDSTEFIKEFPSTISTEIGDNYKIDEIGINSLKFIDSLLIVGHFDHWSIYSADGKTKYGDCLKLGKGPEEFNILPPSASALFKNSNDSLYAYVEDHKKKRIMKFNITEFIKTGNQKISVSLESKQLNNELWNVTPISETEALLTIPNKEFDGFNRRILLKDSLINLSITEELDALSVEKGEEDINLLSKVLRYNQKSEKIVEAMLSLNQINLYSKDGKWGKTICVGDDLDNLTDIEKTPQPDRKYTYTTVSTWDWGFGAVYTGQKESDWQKDEKCDSEIQFFDWNGKPLFKINLNESIVTFDISPDKKHLLAVTADDDLRDYILPDKILNK